MASAQYTAGTVPTLILAAPAGIVSNPAGWFYLNNGTGATIYAGGSAVTSTNGAAIAMSTTLSGFLFPGDQIYIATAAGTSTVGVYQGGLDNV